MSRLTTEFTPEAPATKILDDLKKSKPIKNSNPTDSLKQKEILEKIISLLPPDRKANGRVSFLDETFTDWLKRTGELPPDFDIMPSIPFLPDPLILDEGGKNIPVTTMDQWKEKREWMRDKLEYYITGTYPPKPDNLKS